jgi:hypothetical protein
MCLLYRRAWISVNLSATDISVYPNQQYLLYTKLTYDCIKAFHFKFIITVSGQVITGLMVTVVLSTIPMQISDNIIITKQTDVYNRNTKTEC